MFGLIRGVVEVVRRVKHRSRLYLVVGLVATLILLGLAWTTVYYFAFKPLLEIDIPMLGVIFGEVDLTSTLWWRSFIHFLYDVVIVVVVAYISIQTLAIFSFYAREPGKYRAMQETILKYSWWQRIQHHLLVIGFALAAFTGIVMYQNNNPYWKTLFPLSRDTLIILHIIGGVLMGAIALLHLVFYATQFFLVVKAGVPVREVFPVTRVLSFSGWKTAAIDNLLYLVGLKKRGSKPPAHKYAHESALEYWMTFAGVAIIGVTGIIMALYGPRVLDGVVWVIHFKEAVLAISALLAGHLASVHFNPAIAPLDSSIFTGRVPLERIREENILWYEELVKKKEGGGSGS